MFTLHPNFPNPFNAGTQIRYELPVASHIQLTIYDVLGRQIRTLNNLDQAAGYYETQWDALSDAGEQSHSGIFFIVMNARSEHGQEFRRVFKMLLIR